MYTIMTKSSTRRQRAATSGNRRQGTRRPLPPFAAYLSRMPRIAIAQIRPSKGEYAANLQKIGGVLAQIAKLDPPVDLVIFPETVTSGYFVEGGVRDVAVTAGTLFRDLTVEHEAAAAPPIDVAVGFYEVFQNHFYNSCLYASLGNASPGNASLGNASLGNASPGGASLGNASPGGASLGNASPGSASTGHASPGIKHVHRKV